MTTSLLKLPDGRHLAYSEFGPAAGRPMFYFHGNPGSQLEWLIFGDEEMLRRLNLRVIATDRPGIGQSDFQPGRRLRDWPADVAALADHLGIQQFSVLGYSAGAAFALACAHAMPGRVRAAAVVSGECSLSFPGIAEHMAASAKMYMKLAINLPWFSRLFINFMMFGARKDPGQLKAQLEKIAPPSDKQCLDQVVPPLVASILEGARSGPRGLQVDAALGAGAWDFRPEEIKVPVHFWHGEADVNAPVAMGRYVSKLVPGCTARFEPEEGHVSLFLKYREEILAAL